MGLLVELLESIGLDVVLDVAVELRLVTLLIVVGEGLHVLGNVTGEDVLAEGLGVELLGFDVVSREAVLGVGDEETTVRGTLHGTEDASTGGGTSKTDIQEDLERAAGLAIDLDGLGEVVLAIGLLGSNEVFVQLELLKCAAGEQETGGVGSSPVGETVGDSVGLQLMGVGSAEDLVAANLGGDDLGDDVAVGESHNEPVLGCVVLVLGLSDQALARIVIGLSLSSTLVLDLITPGGVSSALQG